MRWSGLRSRTEALFAPEAKGRVTVHSTRYGGCSCGRGWIALDGAEIAGLNTYETWHPDSPAYRRWNEPFVAVARTPSRLTERGELTRFDLHHACWEFIHSNSHACLASESPLLKALAVLHAKVGRNRVREHLESETHPLVRYLGELRLQAQVIAESA